ncbi:hypothetical protein BC351_16725 [Paenibacillus ferrarius]|uniref:Uncharacterized protein n=1 Tax=Paenibacillus ferrarius TaxID=1469647 RepID=A0A1V4HRX5_9BACL|nr:hypothetical protein BC351_16725 [Paenibacillus ferrarius]
MVSALLEHQLQLAFDFPSFAYKPNLAIGNIALHIQFPLFRLNFDIMNDMREWDKIDQLIRMRC